MPALKPRPVKQFLDWLRAEGDPQTETGASETDREDRDRQSTDEGEVALGGRVTSTKPPVNDPQLLDLLKEHGVQVDAVLTGGSVWGRVLSSLLPLALILGLFLSVSHRMQQRMMGAGGMDGGIFGFSKSKAKRIRAEQTDTGLDNVAGLENAKADLAEIIDHLTDPQRFRRLGAKIPRVCCWLARPAPARPCSPARSPGRPAYPSSASRARSSWRCWSASAPHGCGTCSSPPRRPRLS
jgi:cell division protease FtsH